MKPGKPMQRTGRIKPRSAKRAKFMRDERVPLTIEMLAESDICEVGPKIADGLSRQNRGALVLWLRNTPCTHFAIGLHEIRKRGQGGSLTDRDNVLRTCSTCNSWIEDNPVPAHAFGLVRRAGE